MAILSAGCADPKPPALQPNDGPSLADPAPRATIEAQRIAYAEIGDREFVSLADFEPRYKKEQELPGARQMHLFRIAPDTPGAELTYTNDPTRTGTGALAIILPAAALVFQPPHHQDFSVYPLLSLALRLPTRRDDLRVTLVSDAGEWTSPRILTAEGWNTVQIDIHRLTGQEQFDVAKVTGIRLEFVTAAEPVEFTLDDILLIDNERTLEPSPKEITIHKIGLDYTVQLPGRQGEVKFIQDRDGLWRTGVHQPVVKFAAPGESLPAGEENIGRLGQYRIGAMNVLEQNPVRLRLVSEWFFPPQDGPWTPGTVRALRWEYTVYNDGRWLTQLRLNNAGGEQIGTVGISLLSRSVAWAGGGISRRLVDDDFRGPLGQWSFLRTPPGDEQEILRRNYLAPARIEPVLTTPLPAEVSGEDHFDAGQGCYVLAAAKGNCRFRIHPPEEGVLRPAFRILGPWRGEVTVNMEGLAIRDAAILPDGSAVFVLPGKLDKPTYVEVFGPVRSKPLDLNPERKD